MQQQSMSSSKDLFWVKDKSGEDNQFKGKWAKKVSQSVNSPEYKELMDEIHEPYRRIDNQGVKCFYFPTYVIFKVKNITDFDFESLSAKINGVLIIDIALNYKGIIDNPNQQDRDQQQVIEAIEQVFEVQFNKDKEKHKGENKNGKGETPQDQLLGHLKKTYLFVQFNRDNPLRLPTKRIFEGQIDKKFGDDRHVKWTIRKQFTISLAPGSFFQDLIAPFNLLRFHLSLSFEDMDVKISKKLTKSQESKENNQDKSESVEYVKFKFNCMKRVGNDSDDQKKRIYEQLLFTDDGSLGEYDLAESMLAVTCQKFRFKEASNDSSLHAYNSYKVVTFIIPFYKYPIMDSLTIFIPLILITILTLFTFVQGPDFNDKIGNIATLMIVYVGLVPVINDSLPPTTRITLIDIVVYCQLLINVLCLVRGYQIRNYNVTEFNDYKIWSDAYFISSVVIACCTGVILFALIIYYCIMKNCFYNLEEADIDESERKTNHWVSPHIYAEARNSKAEKLKAKQEMKAQLEKKANQETKVKQNNADGIQQVNEGARKGGEDSKRASFKRTDSKTK